MNATVMVSTAKEIKETSEEIHAIFQSLEVPVDHVFFCDTYPDESSNVGLDSIERGARRRANQAREQHPGADFYIGIESGVVYGTGRRFDMYCVFIRSRTGRESHAHATFFPPSEPPSADDAEQDFQKYLSNAPMTRAQTIAQTIRRAVFAVVDSSE